MSVPGNTTEVTGILDCEAGGRLAVPVGEVARLLSVSASLVRNEIRDGRLRGKRIGGRVVVMVGDLQTYLEQR